MSERYYRAQVLLEQKQRKALAKIAREEGRSISDVVREMLRLGMAVRANDPATRWRRRARALQQADRLRAQMRERRQGEPVTVDTIQLIDDMRADRDDQILGGLANDRD